VTLTRSEKRYIKEAKRANKNSFLRHCNTHNMVYVSNGMYECQYGECTCKFSCSPFICYNFILIPRRLK
jgi:hypothetical protein